jgi:hypothetical protein
MITVPSSRLLERGEWGPRGSGGGPCITMS